MPPKDKKRKRQPQARAGPEKAQKKKGNNTAGKTARATRTREAIENDSQSPNFPHWDPAKSTKAIDRCENLIHKLSAEVEYLKSLIKPGNKDVEITDRNELDKNFEDRTYGIDGSEEDGNPLDADPYEETGEDGEEVQAPNGLRQEVVMSHKASPEPDSEDEKFKSKEEKFRFQVQKGKAVYLNGVFEPLKEILSSGN
ncbi:hypothetical protein LTR84_010903 [Exophiala bonariae]|uniref:Uncharacterized protein n=1 Tax=Exophiala bonariae TaxID=1690606 RepID=A0AAV9NLD1_9EURO|nr:hypothetical protein LTR84_010903 [Exophiala bonariae]